MNNINLDFSTDKTYELHPVLPKDTPYYYGGHLRYYGLFNVASFKLLNWNEKKIYVWEKAYTYIKKSSMFTKNQQLTDAIEYAYLKGFEINLNGSCNLFVEHEQYKIMRKIAKNTNY
jgi:hypothetical protein